MFLLLEAETYVKSGRDEAALRTIERALDLCEETGERWAMAEVLRTKARYITINRPGQITAKLKPSCSRA